jgi:hypothetical protein
VKSLQEKVTGDLLGVVPKHHPQQVVEAERGYDLEFVVRAQANGDRGSCLRPTRHGDGIDGVPESILVPEMNKRLVLRFPRDVGDALVESVLDEELRSLREIVAVDVRHVQILER